MLCSAQFLVCSRLVKAMVLRRFKRLVAGTAASRPVCRRRLFVLALELLLSVRCLSTVSTHLLSTRFVQEDFSEPSRTCGPIAVEAKFFPCLQPILFPPRHACLCPSRPLRGDETAAPLHERRPPCRQAVECGGQSAVLLVRTYRLQPNRLGIEVDGFESPAHPSPSAQVDADTVDRCFLEKLGHWRY